MRHPRPSFVSNQVPKEDWLDELHIIVAHKMGKTAQVYLLDVTVGSDDCGLMQQTSS